MSFLIRKIFECSLGSSTILNEVLILPSREDEGKGGVRESIVNESCEHMTEIVRGSLEYIPETLKKTNVAKQLMSMSDVCLKTTKDDVRYLLLPDELEERDIANKHTIIEENWKGNVANDHVKIAMEMKRNNFFYPKFRPQFRR
uniref:Uncharacterized protein n=1 Tax=Rhizophagus irregularis (strain DAOM 181602 / DAOM 197198 / MUCL 43194) TaxID=747089 RepID=U9UWW7_RHIID